MNNNSPYKYRWWALACLVLSLLVTGLDVTILNVALPTLSEKLGASTSELQWVMDAYLLVFSALLLPAGSLGDRYGRKKVLLIGLGLFGITSIIAGFSQNIDQLIFARALMGVGGAIIMPLTFSILPSVFLPEERGKASAIWSAGSGVGLLIGPLIGGALLKFFSWGSIFYINVPIILIVLVAGYIFIPESKNQNARRIDWFGMLLSCTAFTCLVYGIIEAPQYGWASTKVLLSIIGGVLFLVSLVAWLSISRLPLFDIRLFRNSRFSLATLALCILMFVLNGLLFFVTQYLQFSLNNTAFETGVKLIPFMVGMVVGSLVSNRVTAKLGTKWILAAGLCIVAVGLFTLSTVKFGDSYNFVALCLLTQGIGVGLSMAPGMNAVMDALPINEVGIGAAVNNTLRQISGTLGVAILGSVVSTVYQDHIGHFLLSISNNYTETIRKSIGAATKILSQANDPMHQTLLSRVNSSFIDGMDYALKISACTILIGAILTIAFLRSNSKTTKHNR